MKKTIGLGLAVALVSGLFAGCNGDMGSTANSSSCEHTYEWIASETSHYKQYTCGCPSPDIAELHYDNDENAFCDACGYLMVAELQLSHIMQRLPFEYNVDALSEKYGFVIDGKYCVIDNADDYCEFLDDVGVPYEGPFDWLFEGSVMLVYLRAVSGSADFMSVKYHYDRAANEIVRETVFQSPSDGEYSDVRICECVDAVKVPKTLFEKLSNEN